MENEIIDITIILKSGEEKIYKDIKNLQIYSETITFDINWKSISGKTFDKKSFCFKDFAGFGIATSEDNRACCEEPKTH